jgi:hypothetical protein
MLVGAAGIIFLTTGNSTVQLAAYPAYRGRITATRAMALVGSTPVGSPVIGALSDVAGPRHALALGAAACLGAVIIGRWPAGPASANHPPGWYRVTHKGRRLNPTGQAAARAVTPASFATDRRRQ